jgi:hypothetical protein
MVGERIGGSEEDNSSAWDTGPRGADGGVDEDFFETL